jgi:hypothetical protein
MSYKIEINTFRLVVLCTERLHRFLFIYLFMVYLIMLSVAKTTYQGCPTCGMQAEFGLPVDFVQPLRVMFHSPNYVLIVSSP